MDQVAARKRATKGAKAEASGEAASPRNSPRSLHHPAYFTAMSQVVGGARLRRGLFAGPGEIQCIALS